MLAIPGFVYQNTPERSDAGGEEGPTVQRQKNRATVVRLRLIECASGRSATANRPVPYHAAIEPYLMGAGGELLRADDDFTVWVCLAKHPGSSLRK